MRLVCVCTCLLMFSTALFKTALADEKLEGIACRSVHLGYPGSEGDTFYCEAKVEQSAPGSYFMVCGFNVGYFGIQELANSKKVVLFSVWDPGIQNDPKFVDKDKQVQVVYHDPEVRAKRFGGEGTGGQSFFDYDWKIGETYRFLVTSKTVDGRSAFSGYFFMPEKKEWKHLVTFSTVATKRQLKGYYSFVEDFKRDRVSTTKPRVASFGNGWIRDLSGEWKSLDRARFTGDGNPVTNIDSGIHGDLFFLATGGETKNEHTKLNAFTERPKTDMPVVPQDVLDLLAKQK